MPYHYMPPHLGHVLFLRGVSGCKGTQISVLYTCMTRGLKKNISYRYFPFWRNRHTHKFCMVLHPILPLTREFGKHILWQTGILEMPSNGVQ